MLQMHVCVCMCVCVCVSILWLKHYTAIKNDITHTQKNDTPTRQNVHIIITTLKMPLTHTKGENTVHRKRKLAVNISKY